MPNTFLRRSFYLLALITFTACNEHEWVPTPIPGMNMKRFEEKAPLPWTYSLNQASDSDNQITLHHFHSRNGAATWWNDDTYYSAEIQNH
jgi:hypothetical protein